MNNFQLCSEINERVVQHFVHCTETHGRHVQYLKFLQTIVKAENKFIKKCQDIVMAEVSVSICSICAIFFYCKPTVERNLKEKQYEDYSFYVGKTKYVCDLCLLRLSISPDGELGRGCPGLLQ